MVKHLPLLCLFWIIILQQTAAQTCPTTGNTVTVTNINASGAGSLANAITCVNTNAPLLNIVFNIAGAGAKIIRPTTTLPSISKAGASIDGNTQGSTVILDGSLLTASGNGLVLAANNISIEGLYIRNFNTPSGIAISVVSGSGALISGNTFAGNRTGISTGTPVQSFLITDNTFGLDPNGATLANTSNAINIGGLPTGGVITGNTIANSGASGINIIGGTVLISNNSIYCNTTEGISRGGTPPAVPTITRANTQQIRGTSASGRTIEVFAHSTTGCTGAPCQGKTLLGTVITPATGIWTLDLNPGQVSAGTQVTATSTQNSNNTSKFSTCATVVNCATLNASASGGSVRCFGDSNGSATASATGGSPTAGYTFLWNTGATSASIANLAPGTYTVTVSDVAGCSDTATATVGEPPALTLGITAQNIACAGGNNGAATANPGGGTPGYNYRWNTGQTAQTISGLGAGNYSVTVLDQNGCQGSETVSLTAPPALQVSITPQQITCAGNNNGAVTANPGGGTPGYTYLWNTGQTTQTISGLGPGTYTVTVTDFNDCRSIRSTALSAPPPLTLSVTSQTIACAGINNGAATANPVGGTPGYTFRWNTGQTTQTISGLGPGMYAVTATDQNSCEISESVVLNAPPVLTISITSQNIACFGGNNGMVTAGPAGGIPGYTYRWNTGQTTQSISGLIAGTYTVTVTDVANCSASQSTTLSAPPALNLSLAPQAVLCFGENNGGVNATINGGTPVYTYLWSNGQTTTNLNAVTAGIYTLTVRDANGCTLARSETVTQPGAALSVSLNSTPETAQSANNGTAGAVPGGGTPAYQYLWSTGSTTANLTNLPPGVYTVTVRDANNCIVSRSISVAAFACSGLTLNVQVQAARCKGSNDGSATAMPAGSSGYSYLWSNGATTAGIANLMPGAYTLTVTDAAGCTVSASVLAGEPPALSLSINKTDESAANQRDGSATANAGGGTPSYQYVWSTGATTASIGNLAPGAYTATIRDVNGCTLSAVVNILPGSGGGSPCTTRPVYAVLTPSKVCGNEPFILEIDELYPSAGLRYHVFLPNGDSINTSQTSVSIRPSSTAYSGEYFVVRDSAGCRSKAVGGAPVEVTSLAPEAFSAGRDTVLCNNNAVALRARVPAGNAGNWIALGPARIDQPGAAGTTARDLTPGDNAFVWKIALPGCPNAALDTVHYFYETEPLVADDKYTLSRAADIAVLEVLLNDRLIGVPDTLVSTVSQPAVGQLEYLSSGKRFRYTVEDDFRGTVHFQYAVCSESVSACGFGCDTATVTIEVLNLPKVPEGLIPEDPGPNGSLTIKGVNSFERVEILIFNRWGDLVYQNKQYDNLTPWQGTFKGKKLPQGAYYYQLQAYDRGNQKVGAMQTGVIYLFERG